MSDRTRIQKIVQSAKHKRTIVKAALRVVRLDALHVDPAYQRDVKRKHTLIVENFNEEALGIPLIGERQDGTLWIVDGLQRITALKKLGKKEARVEIFASDGSEHEAKVFKLVNLNRTKLSPSEEFRALLTAHDEAAWRIKNAVESVGFKVVLGKSGGSSEARATELTCINTLRDLERRPNGVEGIKFALAAVKASWPGDDKGPYNYVVGGLAHFFFRHDGVVDTDRLYPRLSTVTPMKLMYTAQQLVSSGTGAQSERVADVIEKVYRKRLAPNRGS